MSISNIYMVLLKAQTLEFFDLFTPGFPSLCTTGMWGWILFAVGLSLYIVVQQHPGPLSTRCPQFVNTKNVSRQCQNHSQPL